MKIRVSYTSLETQILASHDHWKWVILTKIVWVGDAAFGSIEFYEEKNKFPTGKTPPQMFSVKHLDYAEDA